MEEEKVKKASHCAWQIHYHVVKQVKYRRALIDERVERVMIETPRGIGERYEIEIEALGMDKDHVHLLCGAHLKIAPGSIVMKFKSIIGREFLEFMVLRGNGRGKRELDDGEEICFGPGQAERGFASVNTVVENMFSPIPRRLRRGLEFGYY